nr:hypothetical protein QSJ49_01210 [Halobacterium salinarum]
MKPRPESRTPTTKSANFAVTSDAPSRVVAASVVATSAPDTSPAE